MASTTKVLAGLRRMLLLLVAVVLVAGCGSAEESARPAAAEKAEEAPADDARGDAAEAEAMAEESVARPSEPIQVFVVRHAEKQSKEAAPDPKDPPLTDQGQRRARDLAAQLADLDIDAIYTTDFQRTRQTIAPLATAKGVASTVMEPKGIDSIADDIAAHSGKTLVISGHSNTVPEILAALGVEQRIELEDDDYGDLFVVTIDQGGSTLERRRFGDPGPDASAQPIPAAGG